MGWFSGAVATVDRCVFVSRTSQLTNSYSIFLTLKYSNWLCWDEFLVSVYLMFEDVIECIIEEDVLHVLIGFSWTYLDDMILGCSYCRMFRFLGGLHICLKDEILLVTRVPPRRRFGAYHLQPYRPVARIPGLLPGDQHLCGPGQQSEIWVGNIRARCFYIYIIYIYYYIYDYY